MACYCRVCIRCVGSTLASPLCCAGERAPTPRVAFTPLISHALPPVLRPLAAAQGWHRGGEEARASVCLANLGLPQRGSLEIVAWGLGGEHGRHRTDHRPNGLPHRRFGIDLKATASPP